MPDKPARAREYRALGRGPSLAMRRGPSPLAVAAVLLIMAAPVARLEADPAGAIRGTVKVARPPAPPPPLAVTNARHACGATVPSDELVVGAGGVLANAVVWLPDAVAPVGARPAPVELVLDQQRCRFTPHVATATAGAQLAIGSRDPILHNVHARLGTRSLFNVAIPVAGLIIRKPLRRVGHVTIGCDVHSWMSAHVHVFAHPYHAVTGADGTFQIPRVPAGTHAVRIWHERLGEKTASVTVANGTARLDVTY